MKKFYRHWFIMLLFLCAISGVHAQADTIKPVKIAVFVPLYLDEAFAGYSYQLSNEVLPKNILPGLEFYNGVMMAVDSLSKEGAKLEINIYDSKQSAASLNNLFNGSELNNVGLIIASLNSAAETKIFADQALNKNIPLISATYPSVGSVNANPFFVLLNSSLRTHLEGIYKHLQNNYAGANIIVYKRAGAIENYIKSTFTEYNKTTLSVPLKFKWVELGATFNSTDVIKHLDSTKNNVVLVASPLESFGLNVVKTISAFDQYRTTAVGMPTWDGIKEMNGKDCENVEIVYSTPFNYSRSDHFESTVAKKYRTMYYSRPSDMVFRGFETTYHFGKLLLQYRSNLINNLSSGQYKLFNDFNVVPVKLKQSNMLPDYLENKKLYFIKKQEGNVKAIY